MKRKFIGSILSAVLLATCFATTVGANNCKDRHYHFIFCGNDNSTGVDSKEDDSSSYMTCTYAPKPYTAYVYSLQNNQFIDCSMGHSYLFYQGTTRFLLNNVYERGFRNAGIMGRQAILEPPCYSAEGEWSPDSV